MATRLAWGVWDRSEYERTFALWEYPPGQWKVCLAPQSLRFDFYVSSSGNCLVSLTWWLHCSKAPSEAWWGSKAIASQFLVKVILGSWPPTFQWSPVIGYLLFLYTGVALFVYVSGWEQRTVLFHSADENTLVFSTSSLHFLSLLKTVPHRHTRQALYPR